MQAQNLNAAHSLYVLYETLSDETQQLFLQELLAKQRQKIELSLKQSVETNKNRFSDICGILTAEKTVSLEEMEQAIAQQGTARLDDCN